ncbi:hypothetical protein KKI90_01675 [Xenorhabdus bovienii]|uniref:hypothetical protein n=1 Tax=Xenorhabdus bovienii TaxID=40576 RepID=UPI00237CE4FF|nr:hypothetical protein [Xenorhabdus bovienii]MDE1485163.1 hypothetical protein [Xenorhabdus bovienii]MDE9477986.1 hypothetical protein [Xenorhabdus bovienii]MDE9492879.1 hypothetical protein [Xenorhabdus bovienii]MDE9501318.1 hypothetical protein [Xenorhabdus bovienii]MDE9525043.1 hypothetical protein [Xenorhabdus bovienii]
MKLKRILKFLKLCFFIIFMMIGLMYVAHLSVTYPDLSDSLGQNMYRWRYILFLWRLLLYIFVGRFLWKLWFSSQIPSESRKSLKRIAIIGALFILVSEIVVWVNEGIQP